MVQVVIFDDFMEEVEDAIERAGSSTRRRDDMPQACIEAIIRCEGEDGEPLEIAKWVMRLAAERGLLK